MSIESALRVITAAVAGQVALAKPLRSAIYAWLHKHASTSPWAKCVAEFLEIAEAKLIERKQFTEGTLTTFSEFPFGPNRPSAIHAGHRGAEHSRASVAFQGRPALSGAGISVIVG